MIIRALSPEERCRVRPRAFRSWGGQADAVCSGEGTGKRRTLTVPGYRPLTLADLAGRLMRTARTRCGGSWCGSSWRSTGGSQPFCAGRCSPAITAMVSNRLLGAPPPPATRWPGGGWPARSPVLRSLARGDQLGLAAVDQLLPSPGIDHLTTDTQVGRNLCDRPPGCDAAGHLKAELRRITSVPSEDHWMVDHPATQLRRTGGTSGASTSAVIGPSIA
jgi:hypothetical protein